MIRRTDTQDRRFNIIQLTDNGRKLLDKIEPLYAKEVHRLMGSFTKQELKEMASLLEQARKKFAE
jgi:DNA-binding MarR family transcriptional regulator